ncbi:MAG: transposase [Bacteroidales bacterium]|nr:transposase [Bacteroidales bacterium]
MPQSFTKVYVHITFSTKNRYPSINKEVEQELWTYIGGVCKALECSPIRIGEQFLLGKGTCRLGRSLI